MSTTTQVQFRRGNTSNIAGFVGASGEVNVNTDIWAIVVQDSQTVGGWTGARIIDLNSAISNLSGYVNNTFLTASNLTNTGIILLSIIQNTGQLNYLLTSGVSGNLTQTGILLYNRDLSISGYLQNEITGISGYLQNNSNAFTGASGALYNQILGVSGFLQNEINNIVVTGGGTGGIVNLPPGIVYTTGTQTISGTKTFFAETIFQNDISIDSILSNSNLSQVNLFNQQLIDGNSESPSLDWSNRTLIGGDSIFDLSLDWQNRLLYGNWNVTSGILTVQGNPVLTGTLPSSNNNTGSYFFNTAATNGLSSQFISFPTNMGNNPYVLATLNNTGNNNENILVQWSGITSSGYWANYSSPIDSNGFVVSTIASSTQSGYANSITIINGATGNFYPNSNPSGFITGVNTGNFISNNQTGQFYASSNPSGYITGINTGNFYTNNNPSGFITTGQTGNFGGGGNTGQLTGAFYPLHQNPSGYITGTILPSINYNTNINWASSNTFYTQLTGNTNFVFSNQVDGQTIVVKVNNTGLNSFSGIWNSVKWPFSNIPFQSSGNVTDIYTFICITGAIYGTVIQGFN